MKITKKNIYRITTPPITSTTSTNSHLGFGSPMTRNDKENGSPVIINISVSGRDWNNGHLPPFTDGPTMWTCPTDSTLPNAFDATLERSKDFH